MADDKTPQIFANKVIRQIVQHTLAEDMVIQPEDYLAIRKVFSQCAGSWEGLGNGDLKHLALLKKVITVWGKRPGRVKESDRLV